MPKGAHLKKEVKREKTFLIRFTDIEFQLLKTHCNTIGTKKTDFVRNSIFAAIEKQRFEAQKQLKINFAEKKQTEPDKTELDKKQGETLPKPNQKKPTAKELILQQHKQGKSINEIVEYLNRAEYKTRQNTNYNYDNVNKMIIRNTDN